MSVFQVFTGKYDLVSGGVESRRKNAEFVGRTAADAFEELRYWPVEFGMTPPKRGGECPENWPEAADEVAARITSLVG
ncbi:MAG: hypothetical protein V5A62_09585 [Haloarculaceae archaeon]